MTVPIPSFEVGPADSEVPFSVGVDCEEIERWRLLLPQLAEGRAASLFTPQEHEYCRSYADPATVYAGRWTAKEAVAKAVMSYAAVSPRDIEIVRMADGGPRPHLSPGLSAAILVDVSITHTATLALAFAVATRRPDPRDQSQHSG